MEDYDLENLISIFNEHAKFYDAQRDFQLNEFKKTNPDKEVPEWFLQDFNLARSLSSMCSEIIKLKNI